MFFSKDYMAGARRKTGLYVWTGISAVGEVWLMQNAGAQCTLEGREEAEEQRKLFKLKLSS